MMIRDFLANLTLERIFCMPPSPTPECATPPPPPAVLDDSFDGFATTPLVMRFLFLCLLSYFLVGRKRSCIRTLVHLQQINDDEI